MRADLEELFDSLILLHRRKLALLEGFARSIVDKRYYLKTGDIERLAEAVADDSALFELIDTIDYDIGCARDRMNAITGTEGHGIDELMNKSGGPKAAELFEIRSAVGIVLRNASKEHDELARGMEKISSKIRSDADALSGHLRLDLFNR
ncbi:MAG TPA: hypothetical protein VLM75_09005 [Spirochaetota bacterium]|nr:hypothetical protein [Spirochaetota bacterium]